MVKGFYAQIVETLKGAGCEFRRTGKGDHEIWHSPITNRTFTLIAAVFVVTPPMR